jgi:hypothetical protein
MVRSHRFGHTYPHMQEATPVRTVLTVGPACAGAPESLGDVAAHLDAAASAGDPAEAGS